MAATAHFLQLSYLSCYKYHPPSVPLTQITPHKPVRIFKGNVNISKEMKMTSIFKAMEVTQQHVYPSWHWPSCTLQPKTLSFRAGNGDEIFKTVNSAFLDDKEGEPRAESPSSCFSDTSMSASLSVESDDRCCHPLGDSVEDLVREMARCEGRRLFFEPGESKTSSILSHEGRTDPGKGGGKGMTPFKGTAVALAVESEDPYHDFRRSMEEMVESHGLEDWDGLEELLSWYLRVNGDANHGLIIDAFIDLLVSLSPNRVVPNEEETCKIKEEQGMS
ncbi:hypothetical protein MLD38_009858 [Melastoma candidum]|uniref:Uncharacterized protein n=1 Tax=Melastoma candidum TaxID=119954 RepID=A0ACB9RY08_9MYRT|nr:hypothetical protein MLD38_009858 [Melastoma candidum]